MSKIIIGQTGSDIDQVLLDMRYEMAFADDTEEAILDLLDYWLSEWLYLKSQCPECGNT